jgi:hypothetical protein
MVFRNFLPNLRYGMLYFCLGIFLFVFVQKGKSGEIPKNNSFLNYTTVYFEKEMTKGAVEYMLQVYSDSINGKIIHSVTNKLPAFWIENLDWGKTYFWKITSYNVEKKILEDGSYYKFTILAIKANAFDKFRVNIKTNKEQKHAKGFICVDYLRSVIDRNGKAVWTIPNIHMLVKEETQIRDMKITKDNTVTFLTGKTPIEMDLEGNVLWKAPFPYFFNGDSVMYHHDFKKTKRGTYMVMGIIKVYRKVLEAKDTADLKKEFEYKILDNVVYRRTQMTLILEFDIDGNLLWYWNANDYIKDEDLNFKKNPRGLATFATHANAFSENEQGTKIYVGFRDLSRIVRIDKATKKVESSFGEKFPSGEATYCNHLFNHQHDATCTKKCRTYRKGWGSFKCYRI